MTPEAVLQERKDRQESRARPFSPAEEKADTDLMEKQYQDNLKAKAPQKQ